MKRDESLLANKVNNAPRTSGVYLMRDGNGNVIYVGKSKNLRTRVRSYFGGQDSRPMVPFLVSRIHDLEFIVTDTEKEALILENTLIKKYRPRYNVDFRDDKNYFSIRIDRTVTFPRFQLVRRIKKDGAKYFGPYSSSASVKETLHFLHRIFPLRTCKDMDLNARKRPCIEYEIKRCCAPCCGLITKEAYRRLVRDAVLFMEGRGNKLISELKKRMFAAADELNFEEASRIRDTISAITDTLEKQRVVSMSFNDQDVFGFYRSGSYTQACLIYIRKGNILGTRKFPLFKIAADSSEVVSSLLKRYYDGGVFIPREIIIPESIEDKAVIEEWLAEQRKGKKVSIIVPKRGDRKNLLDIAGNNAANTFHTDRAARVDERETLNILAERLHLRKVPHRIECFDISNVGGRFAVGSMVSFMDGYAEKEAYRRFRIKTIEGADDYAMLREVVKRRYRESDRLPDLIVVDGGKGQLNVVLSVLRDLDIQTVDAIGLAKERSEDKTALLVHKRDDGVYKDEDRIYLPKRKNPLYLSRYPAALFLLQRIRDEAHRFALSYHRQLKGREDLQSSLDDVPGIGDFRKRTLLSHFRSIENIKAASKDELTKVHGIGVETAEKIFGHFHAT